MPLLEYYDRQMNGGLLTDVSEDSSGDLSRAGDISHVSEDDMVAVFD